MKGLFLKIFKEYLPILNEKFMNLFNKYFYTKFIKYLMIPQFQIFKFEVYIIDILLIIDIKIDKQNKLSKQTKLNLL